MPIFLEAVSLKFYRGIGPERQDIGPFSEINLFIGANNSGKSTVLNFIREQLPFGRASKPIAMLGPAEDYRGATTGRLSAAIGISPERFVEKIENEIGRDEQQRYAVQGMIERIVDKLQRGNFVWVSKGNEGHPDYLSLSPVDEIQETLSSDEWQRLWRLSTGMGGGGPQIWASDVVRKFLSLQAISFPNVAHIPAERDLGESATGFQIRNEKSLIDELAELQSPDYDRRDDRLLFDKITEFVRVVTGKDDVEIEVPHDRRHLLVHIDNKVLPLFRLGTGIQEVILLAAFCSIHDNMIVCIEEPEIHLHPILQRKLIRYLREKTSNQYFIATHSAAFIDTPKASIFRVENDGVQTYISIAVNRGAQKQICDELGYRASDILQSNAVIWVEGPSDRIYIRHWLNAVAPELVEGIHYMTMFYGGALVRHLGAAEVVDENNLNDFIDLRSLNQNMVILLDSDRKSARSGLKPAVKRLRDEMENTEGLFWLTKGREVENYVDPDLLQEALGEIHKKVYAGPVDTGPYDHAFYFKRKYADSAGCTIHKAADKVRVAEFVCSRSANLDVLDLKARLKDVAGLIRTANGLMDN